ncbi:MAG TPA: glucoamylase family protein [Gemmatimonadota bacterium]|nr:glucoamylase family protein [Gemmatimonadota bacterium]
MISLPPLYESHEPIRAEIFGAERFEQHAESLAAAQTVYPRPRRGVPVLARLENNARILRESYQKLTEATTRDQAISPAAEWLIDNFHIIEEQILEIREGLPAKYYRELPKLAAGHLASHPRVYGLAWAFVAHTDSRFDAELLERFARAYQKVAPLTMGELWALPITLRLILVENMRRIAESIVGSRVARVEAGELADLLLEATHRKEEDLLLALGPYETSPLSASFAVELVQRLRDSDPAVMPVLGWLEERLAAQGTTADEIVRREHMSQLAAHATIVNIIGSMRQISAFDWAELFENVSLVERILRRDPTRVYPQMDFATRDAYRHVIETLARGTELTEEEVAERVVERAAVNPPVGSDLIGEGRRQFEREIGYRPPLSRRLREALAAFATPFYLGTIAAVSGLLVLLLLAYVAGLGAGAPVLVVLGLLSLIPATDLAIAVLHQDIIELFDPRRLPKLDFESGIPEPHNTLVAVPTVLTDELDTREQVERLERHYLSGAHGHITFALLSDWRDAEAESLPGDDRLVAVAAEHLADINDRYGPRPDGGPRFLLLHRRRVWNPRERQWMGWERKRGKIHELNQLLRGARDTTFLLRGDGLTDVPAEVRHVITLDADTRLPPGIAHRLVGAMAHPLNRPRFDPRKRRVTAGYAILQPRITPMLPPAGESSLYHHLYAGPTGIDPYSSAVSDVYQDLFGEGSYVGKGIYDVDAFEASLSGRVPENALLSHDLFEGSFARTGLVTDVELFDDFPTHYETSARRMHRWARGDWQLLPWVLNHPPASDGANPAQSSLPAIARWKMIDNLRRTLSPISTFLLLVAGWVLVPVSPLVWTGFVVATIAMPAAVPVLIGFLPRRRGIAKRSHIRGVFADLVHALARVGLAIVFIPNRTVIMADAIGRTLVRLAITRRHLLEWVTAAQAGHGVSNSLRDTYRRMWRPVLLAALALLLLLATRPSEALQALPVMLLWFGSPAFALWLSRPLREAADSVGPEGIRSLRRTARQTWRYFEEYVGPEDHWLPPDNVQLEPAPAVAHRTSPTNLGMYLLSVLAARDFAWIGTIELEERLSRAFAAMDRLERLRGHFFNWYDTRSLAPLEPRYLSTVDSGNLAGHLLALAEGCRELSRRPLCMEGAARGIGDAVELAHSAAMALGGGFRRGTVSRHDLDQALLALRDGIADPPQSPAGWAARLEALEAAAEVLVDVAEVLDADEADSPSRELAAWARAVRAAIASQRRDLNALAPWAALLAEGAPEEIASVPELSTRWEAIEASLSVLPSAFAGAPTFEEVGAQAADLRAALDRLETGGSGSARRRIDALAAALARARDQGSELATRLERLAEGADRWVEEMDFSVLYDPTRDLFSVGYRPADGRLDPAYYDLLGSEARLASLVAIAKRDVPVEHWFRLGRPVTPVGRGSALLSWSGSMFEYLMPFLVMDSPPGTLIDRTQRLIVRRQIQYGIERGVPWGVSESAYNGRDLALTYQYSHFGVPGLGLTRGLAEDLVVAPYATALAAMIEPRAAVHNFARLDARGGRGRLGFYEALDFTPERVPKGRTVAPVVAYMTHHQGMTIVAIDNALNDGIMRERFHDVPMIGATELLLQERIPRDVAVARPRPEEVKAVRHVREIVPPVIRRFGSPHTKAPRTHVLSNGRYSVMITNGGGGYSRFKDLAVTRWREDPTRDNWGSFVYVRDVASGATWSAGYQPSAAEPDSYEAAFSEDRAEIRRRDEAIWTSLEVIVSPEDDGELRRVTVKNLGARTRDIELTSYAELVLAPPDADRAHPAFQKLFVQTEYLPTFEALLGTRRPRTGEDPMVWAVHVAAVQGEMVGALQYETDRARFLDRGRGVRRPSCVAEGRPLSNTTGPVLDPILSLRRTVRLRSGETARVTFSTLVTGSREEALAAADKYREPTTFEREAALAWTQAQVQLQHLGITPDEAHLFQRLASRILYLDPALRPPSAVLSADAGGQRALWPYGISGDLPILLVRIDQMRDRDIVRQLIRAHEYWGWKGLAVDLVVMNEHAVSYAEDLQAWLERSVRVSQSRGRHEAHAGRGARPSPGAHGEVHILRADQLPAEDRDLLRTVARAVLLSHHGALVQQLDQAIKDEREIKPPASSRLGSIAPEDPPPRPRLAFFNGLGGFAEGGREYVTILGAGQWTPAPWINVIANPHFGFQVSESGSGFTWAVNSRENRLTPWSNDPVSDPAGEVLYVRDEDSGALWTPTPLPIREAAPYQIHHGQGWTRFEVQVAGIASELLQFVPLEDPIKISRLRLTNHTDRVRHLSVNAYVEWVLGDFRERSAPYVFTEIDPETRALFARNRWNAEYAGRVAFADMAGQQDEWTADRTEFLGRNGTLRRPDALGREGPLSGRTGAGWDPCAALRGRVEIAPGGRAEIVFLLGQGEDTEAARRLVAKYRIADLGRVLEGVLQHWEDVLEALQVRTPDYSMSILLNRWLLYQVLSCRVWARSAFYQSGGAFGFRDQLQDIMALAVARREIARDHILRSAARQFPEGDVQHWWHTPSGRGVRTRISDDRIWLPFALVHYLQVTGDEAVLDEEIPFLESEPLPADQAEAYFEPAVSDETATLYDHCARSLDVSLDTGRHGLPLIGTGDWNDGMNRVGEQGEGESVWLAWFLDLTLGGMIPIAEARGDEERAGRWQAWRTALGPALSEHAWDGDWYRRAFFDDGTPLGSAANEECRIDSIAQSWAVIAGSGPPERAAHAMKAVEQYLVRRGDGLVLLFTPPFDRTPLDPGYIKGYLPGVRENGGQYTHGAIWSVIAFAQLGDGDKAAELFSILNPINHGSTRAGIHRYKVEPYVSVADVYAEPPHVGRGGWTWYTGSAGWMYRAGVEWILGFRLRGATLHLDPCIPRDWPGFEISFRYHSARYEVAVENPAGVMRGVRQVELDGDEVAAPARSAGDGSGAPAEGARIPLVDDGNRHKVRVVLG